MANRFLGEVSATAGGRAFTLRMDFNTMCEFEEAAGVSAITAFKAAEEGKVSIPQMRQMVHAAMKRYHPDATISDAGDVISEDQGILQRLIAAAAPEVEDAPAGKRRAGAKRTG